MDAAAPVADAGAVVGRAGIDGDCASAGAARAAPAAVAADDRADSAVASSSSALRHRHRSRRLRRLDGDSRTSRYSSPADRPDARDAGDVGSALGFCIRTLTTCAAAPPTGRSCKALSSGWTSVVAVPVFSVAPCPRFSQSPNSCNPAVRMAGFVIPLCHDGPSRGRRPIRSCSIATCAVLSRSLT